MRQVFCRESRTGIVINYDGLTGMIRAAIVCHPEDGFRKISEDTISCTVCNTDLHGPSIKWKLEEWSMYWVIDRKYGSESAMATDVAEWVSGWTGLPQEDLAVTVLFPPT